MQLERLHVQALIRELKRDLTDITKQHLASEWPSFMVERIAQLLAYEYFDDRGSHSSIVAARALFALCHAHMYFQSVLDEFEWVTRSGDRRPLTEEVFDDAASCHAWQPVMGTLGSAWNVLRDASDVSSISVLPAVTRNSLRSVGEDLCRLMQDQIGIHGHALMMPDGQ